MGRPALEVLVCFDDAIIDSRLLRDGESLRVGDETELPAPVPAARFALAGVNESLRWLQLPSGASALLRRNNGETALVGPRRVALVDGDEAVVELAPLRVLVRVTSPGPAVGRGRRADPRDFKALAVAAGAVLAFLGIAFSVPPDAAWAAGDLTHLDNHTLRSIYLAPVEKLERAKVPEKLAQGGGSRARGREGAAGRPETRAHGKRSIAGHDDKTRAAGKVDAAAEARMMADNMFGGAAQKSLKSLLDPDATALGEARKTFDGNLDGLEAGDGWGNHAEGTVGDGPGGGCKGIDCYASISVGTLCTGDGCMGGTHGHGHMPRGLGVRIPKHEEIEIPSTAKITVPDGIDKETIRRVIRAHVNEFRFCYERALTGRPDLEGKVVVGFVIVAPDGHVGVAGVRESTLADPSVGRCVADTMQRLRFPMPPGAPSASISYPMIFHPAGATR